MGSRIPNITPASNIKISDRVEIFQRLNPERIGGNQKDAILHKRHHKLHDLNNWYDMGYDIAFDIGYDIMQKKTEHGIGNDIWYDVNFITLIMKYVPVEICSKNGPRWP
jgi:hypothetical protein